MSAWTSCTASSAAAEQYVDSLHSRLERAAGARA